jgi:hypothetical protein
MMKYWANQLYTNPGGVYVPEHPSNPYGRHEVVMLADHEAEIARLQTRIHQWADVLIETTFDMDEEACRAIDQG